MSGKYQHNIPQNLQRGFAVERKSKKYQVTVYDHDRGIFTVSIGRVAGEGHFYSQYTLYSTAITLDYKITEYESDLASFINKLRTAPSDLAIDAGMAARTVTHYAVRAAYLRHMLSEGIRNIAGGLCDLMQSPTELWHFLGLDRAIPSKAVRDQLRESWREHRHQLQRKGIT